MKLSPLDKLRMAVVYLMYLFYFLVMRKLGYSIQKKEKNVEKKSEPEDDYLVLIRDKVIISYCKDERKIPDMSEYGTFNCFIDHEEEIMEELSNLCTHYVREDGTVDSGFSPEWIDSWPDEKEINVHFITDEKMVSMPMIKRSTYNSIVNFSE